MQCWEIGVLAYFIRSVVSEELTRLNILACNDKGLPNKIRTIKIMKFGYNLFGTNITLHISQFVAEAFRKAYDACK